MWPAMPVMSFRDRPRSSFRSMKRAIAEICEGRQEHFTEKCCTLKRLVLWIFQWIPSCLLISNSWHIEAHTHHLFWVIPPLCSHCPDGKGAFHHPSFHPSKGAPCISLYGFASSSWAFDRVKINDISCSHRSLAAAATCFFSKSAYAAWFSHWSKVFISCWFKLLVKLQRNCHIHFMPGCSA